MATDPKVSLNLTHKKQLGPQVSALFRLLVAAMLYSLARHVACIRRQFFIPSCAARRHISSTRFSWLTGSPLVKSRLVSRCCELQSHLDICLTACLSCITSSFLARQWHLFVRHNTMHTLLLSSIDCTGRLVDE